MKFCHLGEALAHTVTILDPVSVDIYNGTLLKHKMLRPKISIIDYGTDCYPDYQHRY